MAQQYQATVSALEDEVFLIEQNLFPDLPSGSSHAVSTGLDKSNFFCCCAILFPISRDGEDILLSFLNRLHRRQNTLESKSFTKM